MIFLIAFTYCYYFQKISLHKEIEDFFAYMSATPEEHSMRLDVLERVTNVIHAEWPKAKVEVFGSFRTGLYLPTRYRIFFLSLLKY